MKQILSIIMNVNYIYLLLVILSFNALFIMLYRNKRKNIIPITTIMYILLFLMTFNYFDSLFNSVLSLSYSSTRVYLLILIITNIITLVTINTKINIFNKILNYILFISSVVIFFINILLLINNNINLINIDILNMIYTIDINIIIFIAYLYITFITYIVKEVIKEIKYIKKREKIITVNNNITIDKNDSINFDLKNSNTEEHKQEELSSTSVINDNKKFIIDGKDCSFIFDDPNKENAIKNYYILLTDVNARLVNGYTVDENIKINNILNRLNIKNINNLNLMSMDILSKLNDEEYNLLKNLVDNYKKNL